MGSGNTSKPTRRGHLTGDGRRRGGTGPQGRQATRRLPDKHVMRATNSIIQMAGKHPKQNIMKP